MHISAGPHCVSMNVWIQLMVLVDSEPVLYLQHLKMIIITGLCAHTHTVYKSWGLPFQCKCRLLCQMPWKVNYKSSSGLLNVACSFRLLSHSISSYSNIHEELCQRMNFLFNAENWLLEAHFSPLAVLTLPHHQMWNILQNLLDAKNVENENINMHKEEKVAKRGTRVRHSLYQKEMALCAYIKWQSR